MESILRDLTRTKELLSTINAITSLFVDKPDDTGFNLVLDEIVKFMNSNFGVLGYLSKNKEYLNAAMSGNVWDVCGITTKTGKVIFNKHDWKGIWGEIIYEGKAKLVNNGNFIIPNGHVLIKNVLGVPIIRKEDIIGYIILASNEREYTKDDLRMLQWICNWISPVIYTRLKELEFQVQMEKIQLSILEMLNYANMFVLILDDQMKIKFINYSLATELGFKDELEPLGMCWLDFVPEKVHELVKVIHSVVSTTDDREKYKEVSSDILTKEQKVIAVKWFNIRINHIYNWTFSFGLNQTKILEITEDSIRSYWEDRVLRDTTMIQSMKDLLTSEKKQYDTTCEPRIK